MPITHRQWRNPTHNSWATMIQRCNNPKAPNWKSYGGRGIGVCDRWKDFINFFADMGSRPKGTTLDRYPNKYGNYEPGNCRWATLLEQRNNTRANHLLDFDGEKLTIAQVSRKVGLYPELLASRLRHGWSLERAVNTPMRSKS